MTLSVLVVGGAGYVGSHAVKHLLKRGHRVTAFDNLSRGHADAVPPALLFRGDLLDEPDVAEVFRSARFDVVMHYAGLCYVGESVTNPHEYYSNNVVGTLNLLNAMLAAGVRRLVFSSTCATYGEPLQTPIPEEHPQRPISPYGASKLVVERVLRDYAKAYAMSSVSLRYFNAAGCDEEGLLGERHDPETHLIPLVLREARRVADGGNPQDTQLVVNGMNYDTPDGTCIRDYVHVDDLADAHLRAAEFMMGPGAGEAHAFNLGAERGHSVLEVIECCRRVTGIQVGFREGPRRPGDPSRLVASSALARSRLGWSPRHQSLESMVTTAWRWFSKCTY